MEDEKELLNYETTHDADLRIWRRRLAVPLLSKIMRNSTEWSVVMADIDGFRNVNSTYGTQIADKVLLTLTERLKTISGKWQMELIRYAGDEFLFLMPDLLAKSDHPAVLEILKAFSDPIILDNIFLKLSASVGIALPVDNLEAEHLIANAEDAMDEARRRGKNQVYVYSEELKDRAHEEHTISEKLIDAIENDKFYMLYQPKVDVKTKLVNGYEALVRMKDSKIGPAQFIPVAEKNGWIWRIGRITTAGSGKERLDLAHRAYHHRAYHPADGCLERTGVSVAAGFHQLLQPTDQRFGVCVIPGRNAAAV